MSSSKDRDLKNLSDLVDHLGRMDFSGTLNVAFKDGSPTSISKKDEMDPDALHRFLHRPMIVKKAKPSPEKSEEKPERVPENTQEAAVGAPEIL